MKAKRRPRHRALIVIAAIAAAIAAILFFGLRTDLQVSRYTLSFSSLPAQFDGCRIALITDLHSERFGDGQSELLNALADAKPDIVVLAGDIIDSVKLDFAPVEELCAGLEGCTVYAVYGNHEAALSYSDARRLRKLYSDAGVELLIDETVLYERGGESIAVTGMDDPYYYGQHLAAYLENHPIELAPAEGVFNLLIAHRADAFPALRGLGFDLVLSGHLHGGQIRLPIIGGLLSQSREWFPKYSAGKYSESGTTMIVGRGLGNPISIPRVFNRPELVIITLISSDS